MYLTPHNAFCAFILCLLPFIPLATPSLALEPHDSPAWKQKLPQALEDWKSWALWESSHLQCPSHYNAPHKTLCAWPSKLTLNLHNQGGSWQLDVHTFAHTWIPLPGSDESWPQAVTSPAGLLPVVPYQKAPSVYLPPGFHRIQGSFQWKTLPQSLAIPPNVAILDLTLDGKKIDYPEWHSANTIQLHRKAPKAEEEFLETKIYRLIEDGIPLWLHTQVEINAGGKNREAVLGHILPEGWKIASVEAPIPVVIDSEGRLKAQIRSGKWLVNVRAFSLQPLSQIAYSPHHIPILEEEWIGLQQNLSLRVLEIQGLIQVDVTQTSYPNAWRKNPVFLWPTRQPFQLIEKMRGMGERVAQGITINRTLWLDENGKAITYRDIIQGRRDHLWRLDAAQDHSLGSVKINGQGQLITRNPANQLPGVEIRNTDLHLEAIGRIPTPHSFSATGWLENAQHLSATLFIPPSWRMITAFGPDNISGDWFSQWTLFDFFLCILITGTFYKLFGFKAGGFAFWALALAYHEPSAPRFLWLFALLPIALMKISPNHPRLQSILKGFRWTALILLFLALLPFIKIQLEHALFPQLENEDFPHPKVTHYSPNSLSDVAAPAATRLPTSSATEAPQTLHQTDPEQTIPTQQIPHALAVEIDPSIKPNRKSLGVKDKVLFNQQLDARARIQTGPGIPEWLAKPIRLEWSGPVTNQQKIELFLIPPSVERCLKILRVILITILFGLILHGSFSRFSGSFLSLFKRKNAAALLTLIVLLGGLDHAHAQQPQSIPPETMIETLRNRLTQAPTEDFGADLAQVKILLQHRRLTLEAQIHAVRRSAFPLPIKLERWSPLNISLNGRAESALQRLGKSESDRELWILIPEQGVHTVRIEGMISDSNTWPCRFTTLPRDIQIQAEGWEVTGLNEEGRLTHPEITFTRAIQNAGSLDLSSQEAAPRDYADRDYSPALLVERNLNIGLTWIMTTTVRRLTPATSAITARLPLLKTERILTPDVVVSDNAIEIRLIAGQDSYSWESELSPSDRIELQAHNQDLWVEQWQLLLSPMWSAQFEGIAPLFDAHSEKLSPRWHPWPGESVTLFLARPEAIPGDTVTIQRVTNQQEIGLRQRTGTLQFTADASMGEYLSIVLPRGCSISRLERDGTSLPVFRENDRLIFPLIRGRQEVSIEWRTEVPFSGFVRAEPIAFEIPSTNIQTTLTLPQNRWVLWITGSVRGPALRFWAVVAAAILIGLLLGRVPHSPLRSHEWGLLNIGLTQIDLIAGGVVIAWLFFLVWRGQPVFLYLHRWIRNGFQGLLLILTLAAMGILLTTIASGLMHWPKMYIAGNGISPGSFQWFSDRAEGALPQPSLFTVSISGYRVVMLLWALWIATALIRWLKWGWEQFGKYGYIHRK